MKTKLLLLLALVSCGKEVKISQTKLESESSIFIAEEDKSLLSGTFYKTQPYRLLVKNRNYSISKFSSYQAFEYISALEEGRNYNVDLKGKISGNEIILESISIR